MLTKYFNFTKVIGSKGSWYIVILKICTAVHTVYLQYTEAASGSNAIISWSGCDVLPIPAWNIYTCWTSYFCLKIHTLVVILFLPEIYTLVVHPIPAWNICTCCTSYSCLKYIHLLYFLSLPEIYTLVELPIFA